jgi:hypothetical protein
MYATKHGGQNAASFRAWLDLVVIPSHPSLWGFAHDGEPPPDFKCPVPWDKQILMLLDGDFSHIDPANLDYMAWKGINVKPPPPYTSEDLQKGDANNGTNQAFKDHHWPAAQQARRGHLRRNGYTRPLDRTDIPWMLERACTKAFRNENQLSSHRTVGIVPFDMHPLFVNAVLVTKGTPCVTTKLQLDPAKITCFIDQGQEGAAEEELLKQLHGSRFSTGKMVRYCCTDAAFRQCARLKHEMEQRNVNKKKEASTKYQAAKAKRTATRLEDAAQNEKDKESFMTCHGSDPPCPCVEADPGTTCKWAGKKLCNT